MKRELEIAAANKQSVLIKLIDGSTLTGEVEQSGDNTRVKIRDGDGVQWIPHEDIVHVSRVVKLH